MIHSTMEVITEAITADTTEATTAVTTALSTPRSLSVTIPATTGLHITTTTVAINTHRLKLEDAKDTAQ